MKRTMRNKKLILSKESVRVLARGLLSRAVAGNMPSADNDQDQTGVVSTADAGCCLV